ncbi:VWA domain-containing protein, partial [Stutzerimonas frequens]|uniref:VWA domain-containing protein n=1 Tax=Stutzerimonas frequens TaxID=2968969 RepID=UPI0012DA7AFD
GLPLVTPGAMSFPGTTTAGAVPFFSLLPLSPSLLFSSSSSFFFFSLPHGGTPLAQAIWPAAIEVLRAKGERKILFVITDGEPNSGTDGYCKEMFERCEASGIQVIGLGFGSANSYVLSKLFTKYVAVGGDFQGSCRVSVSRCL